MNHARWMCAIIMTCAVSPAMTLAAEEPPADRILLWPNGAPGAHGNAENDQPWIRPFLPPADRATGTAIVVCPGGGYAHLAIEKEGYAVAQRLNEAGIAAFVLKYRHRGTGYGHPAPLQDVQRALRLVRSRAAEWKLEPNRIGVMGFSAGGHLASSAGTHFVAGDDSAADPIERVSSRPDFMVLVYPVISFTEPFTHVGSRNNLLGADADEKLVNEMSSERQVTAQTPPAFLVHATEDRGVPVENSIAFYQALRKANVPAAMHIYDKGPHGFGLGIPGTDTQSWPQLLTDWLTARGLLPTQHAASKPAE